MTAVSFLDDDTFLGAENWYNLFTMARDADAPTEEERGRLRGVGQFHVGACVNRLRPGSLVMREWSNSRASPAAQDVENEER